MRLLITLAIGFLLGHLYFKLLRGGLGLFVDGRTATAIAAMVLRILTAVFVLGLLARLLGAGPVLIALLGFLLARMVAVRRELR